MALGFDAFVGGVLDNAGFGFILTVDMKQTSYWFWGYFGFSGFTTAKGTP
jgi:hypothetical protein